MRRVTSLYQTSIGKKISMACTGLVMFGFTFVHMIGNMKIYQGADKFDSYAKFLREFGYPALGHEQLLWIARIVLLACVLLHILAATPWLESWRPYLFVSKMDYWVAVFLQNPPSGEIWRTVGYFAVYNAALFAVGLAVFLRRDVQC